MDDKQERLTGRTSFLSRHIGTWLKVAKRFRDGFLVTAGVFYLFGYIVWAINAHRNDMGLLPALEFQYFIAGIAPVLIVLSLYFAVVGIKRLRDKMSVWFDEDVTGWKLYLSWLMFILGAVAVIHILANDAEWFKTGFPGVARRKWLIIISALMIMASYLFLRPVESNLGRFINTTQESPDHPLRDFVRAIISLPVGLLVVLLRWVAKDYFYLLLFSLPILAFIIFVWELYPKIPQEFGGARPRHACLDVAREQISNETVEGIMPVDAGKSNTPIVRSPRVEILFSGSDVMLVKARGRVYTITKSTIRAVTTCD